MATTSLGLGEHLGVYIKNEIASGRYGSASGVVLDALRAMEERKNKVTIPRQSRGLSICEPLKAAVGVATRPLYTCHVNVASQRHISI